MKHFIKILLGVAIIGGICYGLNTLRQQKAPAPEQEVIRPVRTIRLQGGSESFRRRYFGTVQGGRRAELSFRVSGTLRRIYVDKGASVKRGTLLATLDPRDFNTSISQAQSALSQAQAQHKNALADFTRYENLYKQRVIAKAQYDQYKTQVEVTKSAVDSAKANLQSARDALRDTELRAPFDGVIADRMAENYQDITAKQTIFSLQDLSSLEIVFNIPDNDVLLVPMPEVRGLLDLRTHAESFSINAKFEAIPDRVFPLTIKEIATQATAANTYPVTAAMPRQNDIRILPGMAVTVEVNFAGDDIAKADENSSYFVPTTAILNEGGANYVWRFAVGQVSRVPVTVGQIRNDGMVEIEGATLSGGDVIVTAGVYFLHEGQRVRLQEVQ
ncbi:MAG: efflux RND transporter periplasmic adaptor subunit [Synergistaceae bacterium]|nr:efflux RND transporter periplasmic adaptor subunit [Synergistaceae bacterium]